MKTDTITRVDPKTLLVGPNVRKHVELGDTFLGSIRELGVRTPITAVETPEGLVVIDGQRRTLAAVDVELTTVPVFVTAAQTEEERIVDQVVVNEHRSGITQAEAIAAVQELALFDIAVPVIAAKVGLPDGFVEKAVKVGSSAAAKKELEASRIRFDQAVTLASFDEFPDEQKDLLEILASNQSWNFESKARELVQARELDRVKSEISALGLKLISEPDYWGRNDPAAVSTIYLDKAHKKPLSELTHEQVVELASDGLRAFPKFDWVDNERVAVIAYAIAGWKERKLFSREGSATSSKPETPEEIEAAKAERRLARENTKAWVAASTVRIEFLQSLVARRTLPKGWEPHVIGRLLANDSHGSSEWKMTGAILRTKDAKDSYSLRDTVVKHLAAHPTLALQVGLAAWAGSVEGSFEFDRKGWSQEKAKVYLLQLEAWGYTLSDIERQAAKKPKSKAAAA